jgi:polyhydroxybutyrate depolymerase
MGMKRGVGAFLALVLTAWLPVAAEEAGVRASAGCGASSPLAAGASETFTMQAGGLERQYRIHLPSGYDAKKPAQLMLDFHGYTGTAASEEEYTRLSLNADRNGYVVVYPQGTGFTAQDGQKVTSWNDLAGSASPGPEGPICSETADKYPHPPECGEPTACNWASCHDDVGFVGELLDRLEQTLCLDLDRVYATGMSNGGMFVHRLGCDMADRFAAIAPVGGTLARGFNCAPTAPLAIMNIYGSGDGYVSQRGGMSSDGYFYLKAEDVIGKWAEASSQHCDATTTPYPTSGDGTLDLSCVQHDNCASGAEVVHCTWDGEHEWPQIKTSDVGNEVIWEFFDKHSRSLYRPNGH